MGLDDELLFRNIISIRRGRWNNLCKLSTRLLNKHFNILSNNQIILKTINSFNGLKTSPRGSFDRFLLRELNNLEITPKIKSNIKYHFDIQNDISKVLDNLLSNTDVKVGLSEKYCVSTFLNENNLFLETIRSLPISIPIEFIPNHYDNINLNEENVVDLPANSSHFHHFRLYTFIIGLLTLTNASIIIDINILKKIIHSVYYFIQLDEFPYTWLKRQLELNYSSLLSDYSFQSIQCTIGDNVNALASFKEILLDACKPLVTAAYHDLFAANWYLLTENLDSVFINSENYELFYEISDNSIYIGLFGHDLTHSLDICSFVNLYSRFTQNNSTLDSKPEFIVRNNYNNLKSKISILEDSEIELFHRFIGNLWIALTRYETITEPCSKNLQSSIPKAVYEFASTAFGSDLECFSSPFNAQSLYFCSLFPEIDYVFGSRGNFFEYSNSALLENHTAAIVNPPFELCILEKTADIILELLQRDKPLCIMFVGPLWNCDFYNKLSKSKYNKNLLKLEPGSYKYRDTNGYEYKPFHHSFCITLYNTLFEELNSSITPCDFSKLAESWYN